MAEQNNVVRVKKEADLILEKCKYKALCEHHVKVIKKDMIDWLICEGLQLLEKDFNAWVKTKKG